MYMRTGSVVRPNSESTGRKCRLGGFLGFLLGGGGRAAAGDQQRCRIGRLLVDRDAHVVEHRDDRFEDLVVDQLLGQVVVDLLVGQETARLAHLDERLQLMAALRDFLLGQRRLVESELAHQRAFLRARDLHPQRLGLDLRFGLDLHFGSPSRSASRSDRSTSEPSDFLALSSTLPGLRPALAFKASTATAPGLTAGFADFFWTSMGVFTAFTGVLAEGPLAGTVFLAVMRFLDDVGTRCEGPWS
jgi:hypothetical protein